jgi:hypothetical protein
MKYLITIILLLAIAQSEAQVADSLSVKLLNQEMIFWQAQSDSVRFYALLNKAGINRAAGAYDGAINELYRAEKYCHGQDQLAEMNYAKMVNYFLADQYSFCSEITLDSINTVKHFSEYTTMKLYSLLEIKEWERCKKELIKLCNSTDTAKISEIKQFPTTYNYKDPEKCRRMSSVLPGLGEVYAGYPFKGITSFILNGGFLFFAGYNFYAGYYITGVVSGLYPFIKFHSGGKRLSAILADMHNTKESGKLKNKYREEINSLIH